MTSRARVRISVIIPVFDGAETLPLCLNGVAHSEYPAFECIVVDDGSTDDSAAIAQHLGATVISTGGRSGPAKARNLGVLHSTGDLVLFLDADVVAHPDAIGRIAARFTSEPELDALIGAYDDSPTHPGFVSQFKNLMHSFVHNEGNQEAFSFWCGCGTVKRTVYLEHGGLDESYRRPSIEDIELGFRMIDSGRTLALDPRIRCKHLKAWTLWSLVRTDVLQRGIPWMQLILRTGFLPDDLNLSWSHRVSGFLAGLLILLLGISVWLGVAGAHPLIVSTAAAGAVASLLIICWLNRSFYAFLASRKGWPFAIAAIPLHIVYYLYSGLSLVLGAGIHFFRKLRGVEPANPILLPLITTGQAVPSATNGKTRQPERSRAASG